jgi:hypothetical protein
MTLFLPISDETIEKTSVLREFIGGSLFEWKILNIKLF